MFENLPFVTFASSFRQIANPRVACALAWRTGTMAVPGVGRFAMMMPSSAEKHASVLLVEDEALICDMVADVLQEQGFEVQAVSTAGEALRCLQSGSPFDILFTDVNLPGDMDG